MSEKVFITNDNMATFICPKCKASKAVNVAKYKQLDKEVRLKIKCPCGNSYPATLERRKQYRKKTDLPGEYIYRFSGGKAKKGNLIIKDISRAGLRIKVNVMPKFKVGTKFVVEFRLDDKNRTLIKKEVIARSISGHFIGAEFCSIDPSDPNDKALGFYFL